MLSFNKMSLSEVVQALSLAAANANERMHNEYIGAIKRMQGNGSDTPMILPPPLSISNVRVSFSAHVSKADRAAYKEDGGELFLDFHKPGTGNFRGEIELNPYDFESLSGWQPEDDSEAKVEEVCTPASSKERSICNSTLARDSAIK